MASWFEENATKSVIMHTLVVATATWAISTYVLEDDKLNLARSQLESHKTISDQYKSKVDLLQKDVEALRAENAEYRQWLSSMDNSIPTIVPRIIALQKNIDLLKAESASNGRPTQQPTNYSARTGSAFIDERTGLVFTVRSTSPDHMAKVSVVLPGKETRIDDNIAPGHQWTFSHQGENYKITVTTITFLSDTVLFRIDKLE